MDLVVGLGNPGSRYAGTRHNIGFMVADRLAAKARGQWSVEHASRSERCTVQVAGREVILVKPQTYMNDSGTAVVALRQQLAFVPEEILVVLDDFLLDFGRLRFRRKGSDGGHNGLASVLESLRTLDIPRLRVGIGSPATGGDPIDYVLSPFGPGEAVDDLVECSCRAIEVYLEEGIEAAMNRFNS